MGEEDGDRNNFADIIEELTEFDSEQFTSSYEYNLPEQIQDIPVSEYWRYIADGEVVKGSGGDRFHALDADEKVPCGSVGAGGDDDGGDVVWRGPPDEAQRRFLSPCQRCLRVGGFDLAEDPVYDEQ